MITDTFSPVISTDNYYNELTTVQDLARNIYKSRTNFTNLCAALELLYTHFDDVEAQAA
jgi:hypothetical protein